MRLVILSYSHHGRGLGRVARDLGHEVVGVMDHAEAPQQQLMDEFQCPGFNTAQFEIFPGLAPKDFTWTRAGRHEDLSLFPTPGSRSTRCAPPCIASIRQ